MARKKKNKSPMPIRSDETWQEQMQRMMEEAGCSRRVAKSLVHEQGIYKCLGIEKQFHTGCSVYCNSLTALRAHIEQKKHYVGTGNLVAQRDHYIRQHFGYRHLSEGNKNEILRELAARYRGDEIFQDEYITPMEPHERRMWEELNINLACQVSLTNRRY